MITPHALTSTLGAQTPFTLMNSWLFPQTFTHRRPPCMIFYKSSFQVTPQLPSIKRCKPKSWIELFILHTHFNIVKQAKTKFGKKKGLLKKEHLENEKLLYIFFKTLFRKVCKNSTFGKDILKNTQGRKTQEP